MIKAMQLFESICRHVLTPLTDCESLLLSRDRFLASLFFFLWRGRDSRIISSSSKVGSQWRRPFCGEQMRGSYLETQTLTCGIKCQLQRKTHILTTGVRVYATARRLHSASLPSLSCCTDRLEMCERAWISDRFSLTLGTNPASVFFSYTASQLMSAR